MVGLILGLSVREWWLLLVRRKPVRLHETEPVWLPEYKLAAARPLNLAGWITLGFAMARELTGEAAYQRAREEAAQVCVCPRFRTQASLAASGDRVVSGPNDLTEAEMLARDRRVWMQSLDERYRNLRRCC
jgi:hypothetical protein